MSMSDPLTIWAVSDGRTGMENQALGLAEAVTRQTPGRITTKRITIAPPFDRLPRLFWGDPLTRLGPGSDPLAPPWPDIWIACGRRTVPLSMSVKGKGPFVVQTQAPRAPLGRFDLVVPPLHDEVVGKNVFPILGSPNRLTEERLTGDAAKLSEALPPLPRPFVAVLLGGDSKDYRLTEEKGSTILQQLKELTELGYGLLISPSRRTPVAFTEKLQSELPSGKAFIWDGAAMGELANPYFGILGLASRILVTEESANMLTDAAFTGKPVHLLALAGGAGKWRRLHQELRNHGVLRRDAPPTEDWHYSPLRETDRVATEIIRQLKHR